MPTTGWILETAIDRYWETGGGDWPSPISIVRHCPFCDQSFNEPSILDDHISGVHPLDRPLITLDSKPIDTSTVINSYRKLATIKFYNCSNILMSKNGGSEKPFKSEDLLDSIRQETDAHLAIQLENVRQEDSLSTTTAYKISISIPPEIELDKIDKSYIVNVARNEASTSDIRIFADECSIYIQCQDYVDALAEYAYGTLIRDGSGGIQLPFQDYKEKFQKAAYLLLNHDRPVANAICNCIRLALNDFASPVSPSDITVLDLALLYFKNYASGTDFVFRPIEKLDGTKHSLCPIDGILFDVLECISSWKIGVGLSPRMEQLTSEKIKSGLLTEQDRAKFQVLFISSLIEKSDLSSNNRELVSLSNNSVFGKWAEQLIELGAKDE
jgi:hypothetical protein